MSANLPLNVRYLDPNSSEAKEFSALCDPSTGELLERKAFLESLRGGKLPSEASSGFENIVASPQPAPSGVPAVASPDGPPVVTDSEG